MRIIITGGTGFIGRALALELSGRGHEVVCTSRSPRRIKSAPRGASRVMGWNGVDADVLAREFDSAPDGVGLVNLAGENVAGRRWTPQLKLRILHSRVDAARAVAEAVRTAHRVPDVVVQGSAVGYYGSRASESGTVLHEGAPRGGGFLAEVCEKWEAAAAPVAEAGGRLVVVRTGLVMGPGGGLLSKFIGPFKAFVGGTLGSGGQWLPWVHLADETGALAWLVENASASGVYNLCAPKAATMKEFCSAVGRAMRRPSWLPVPEAALRIAMGAEMAQETVLASQRVAPGRLSREGYSFRWPDLDEALKNILSP